MASVDQVISALKRLKQRLPSIVGTEAVEFAVNNIRKEQTATGSAMKARKTRNRSDRRNRASRGLLIDTGNGIRSIQIARAFTGLVSISMEDYMQAHNTGATINHPGRGTPYIINLPARPFLAKSKMLDNKITAELIKQLNKAFR